MTISFKEIEDSDPQLVLLFPIATEFADLFELQLQRIGMKPAKTREEVAKCRWTMYIGTLFIREFSCVYSFISIANASCTSLFEQAIV